KHPSGIEEVSMSPKIDNRRSQRVVAGEVRDRTMDQIVETCLFLKVGAIAMQLFCLANQVFQDLRRHPTGGQARCLDFQQAPHGEALEKLSLADGFQGERALT